MSFDRKDRHPLGGRRRAEQVGGYVNIVQNGGNYGWSVKEGFHDFKPRAARSAG